MYYSSTMIRVYSLEFWETDERRVCLGVKSIEADGWTRTRLTDTTAEIFAVINVPMELGYRFIRWLWTKRLMNTVDMNRASTRLARRNVMHWCSYRLKQLWRFLRASLCSGTLRVKRELIIFLLRFPMETTVKSVRYTRGIRRVRDGSRHGVNAVWIGQESRMTNEINIAMTIKFHSRYSEKNV